VHPRRPSRLPTDKVVNFGRRQVALFDKHGAKSFAAPLLAFEALPQHSIANVGILTCEFADSGNL
jgi:hypothetical protein